MPTTPRLSVSVLESKSLLAAGREKLRQQHDHGTRGVQVGNQLADLLDQVVTRIFEAALYDIENSGDDQLRTQVALVPHGGYGRRDLAPFSDLDLMLLHHPQAKNVAELARRLLADLSDVGLDVGFSTRTPAQAWQLARRDPVIFTSQAESRLLVGSGHLFRRFLQGFRQRSKRSWRNNIQMIEKARRDERRHYGETVFLLEPNVKRSRGSLRDIHFLRWIGFARYGESDPGHLRRQDLLRAEDERALRNALDFLLRIRNDLHFHAGRPYDVLYRSEQVRIAEQWNVQGHEHLLPVEKLMSEYFEHTTNVRNIVAHFLAGAKDRNFFQPMLSPFITYRLENDYRVGPIHISMSRQSRSRLQGNLAEVLHLMNLANQTGKFIEYRLWNDIREDMLNRDDIKVTPEITEQFMSLLSGPSRLGELLLRLHEVGVLDKLIVGMDHARCLLQFNSYHKYTVDEHSIRAVKRATQFATREDSLGRVYRSINDLSLMHLALLIHDLGKGLPGDHSEVGAKLAVQTAAKLGLSKRRSEILEFLVLKHLLMSHLAFRRDTSDEAIILQFASVVGSPELLKMLFVLTAADLAAVGPDVLNPWKVDVLSSVYRRANYHLKGGSSSVVERSAKQEQKRAELRKQAPDEDQEWYENQISALSPTMVQDVEAETLIADLKRIRALESGQSQAWGRYRTEHHLTEYVMGLNHESRTGTFHRLTGALSSQGLEILSANIRTVDDNVIIDRFLVQDPDHEGCPPERRINSICQALTDALENPSDQPPIFRRTWKGPASNQREKLQLLPTRVVIDNTTIAESTIIDIFAHDRVGLLYTITRVLYEMHLSVRYAKIGTYLDQVVDVFYVTDLEGQKIEDESRLERIQEGLMKAIGDME